MILLPKSKPKEEAVFRGTEEISTWETFWKVCHEKRREENRALTHRLTCPSYEVKTLEGYLRSFELK